MYVLRSALLAGSAFDLGDESVPSAPSSTNSASTIGSASLPPTKAGVCHWFRSLSGTPRRARDSALEPE